MNFRSLIILTAWFCLLAGRAFAFDPLFNVRIDYAVGSYPASVCAADLDGDGDSDLAVVNQGSNNISILKNNGNGSFAAVVDYGVWYDPRFVCAVDLDGDGDSDLAVANYGSNNISILKNNGDGTFVVPVNYGVGKNPVSICAADLDGDGDIDLAVANSGLYNISILKNNGNGAFAIATGCTACDPSSVVAADLDGDGDNDLAVANIMSMGPPYSWVSIFKNIGDGAFFDAIDYVVGSHLMAICAVDLDGDGDSDLAVANYSSNISILKNNGNGTFAIAVNCGVGYDPRSICAADLDGDGDSDLAVANSGSNNISILKNNGAFAVAVNYGVGSHPVSICAADLDGDGHKDLAVANSGSDDISILLNATDYSSSIALQCPGDIFVPAFTIDPYVFLPGYQITNVSTIGLSFDYYLVADGPVPLVDNGNPASLSGRTPILSPGESFSPPTPALQLVALHQYVQEEITWIVSEVDYPEITESCVTKVTFEGAITTLLQNYSADLQEWGVILKWTLSEMSEEVQWFILRTEDADGFFEELDTPEISNEKLSFTFQDTSGEPGITYRYRVGLLDGSDRRILFETDPIVIPTMPLTLLQNYPNPFNPSTIISYYLPDKCRIRLEIYDISGRCITRLVNSEHEKGRYSVEWNGKDERGNSVSSGIFFYRLTAGKETISRKMVLLR